MSTGRLGKAYRQTPFLSCTPTHVPCSRIGIRGTTESADRASSERFWGKTSPHAVRKGSMRPLLYCLTPGVLSNFLTRPRCAWQIHLPFDEAVKWVRTTGVDLWGWKCKEDWIQWLHQGETQTHNKNVYQKPRPLFKFKHDSRDQLACIGEGMSQYIPSDPEAYYGPGGRGGGKAGVWKGWDYWLGTGKYNDHSL